tara:strand:+ start:372 stop:728 length:357 start_codon:yes stop_codon:yes gene_type:complete
MNIQSSTNFRGVSGRAYSFNRVSPNSPWARTAGVAIFAARDAFGWRVVRMSEVTGRDHDVRPFCALADAERYGARAVFIRPGASASDRAAAIADLEAGLNPVCAHKYDDARPEVAIAA